MTQNVQVAMNGLATMGPLPQLPHHQSYNIFHGFRDAVEFLADPSNRQKEILASGGRVANRCRIICLTSAHVQDAFDTMKVQMRGEIEVKNESWSLSVGLAPFLKIEEVDFVILNIRPNGVEQYVVSEPTHALNPYVRCTVHSLEAKDMAPMLTQMAMDHFDLASTTVSGVYPYTIRSLLVLFFCFSSLLVLIQRVLVPQAYP